MIESTITLEQMAKTLHISEEGLGELLTMADITPKDGGITFNQAAKFMDNVENDDSLKEKQAFEYLNKAVKTYKIIADTCSILHEQFPVMYERIRPLLLAEGKSLLVPTSVVSELKHLLLTKSAIRSSIAGLLNLLEQGENEGVIEIEGDDSEFGDQQILALVTKHFLHQNVMLLTADRNLARDSLAVNELSSIRGKKVIVSRINQYGFVSKFFPNC